MSKEVQVITFDEPTPKRKRVAKASQQAPSERERAAVQWIEPRISFDNLLGFYEVSTWHRRCVNLKARLVGGLGWNLVPAEVRTGGADGGKQKPDKQHAAIMELLSSPQRERRPGLLQQSFTEIVLKLLVDYYATGNGFLETPRNRAGKEVAEIYQMRAERMRRDRKMEGGYHQMLDGMPKVPFRGFGAPEPASANEVLHFLQYDPLDDYYGAPEWLGALAAMLQDRACVEYNTLQFKNRFMPDVAIQIEGGTLSAEALKSIKDHIRDNAIGVQNAGRPLLLQVDEAGSKITITKLNTEIKDLSFKDGRTMARDEIVAAHGVMPRLLGIMSAGQLGGGSEVEGQMKAFVEGVIRPDQERLEQFLNSTIIASFGGEKGLDGVKWRLKFREMDITDRKADAEYYTKALHPETGWMSQDEVREDMGKEPLEADTDQAPVKEDKLVEKALSSPEQAAGFLAALRERLES